MLKFFGVFGNPIKHSQSPLLHNCVFSHKMHELGFFGIYRRIFLPQENLLRAYFENLSLSGANITLPFKEAAFRQCDEVRGIAKEIGACNAWVKEDSRIVGYNTDAEGFYECVKDYDLKTALIIGAGGAAKAIAIMLQKHRIRTIIINRSAPRLQYFADKGFECALRNELNANLIFDIVINTTSAGLDDESLPCEKLLLERLLGNAKYAFDVIYGKESAFLSLAKSLGVEAQNGRDMLIFQALLAFERFCGGSLERDKILQLMRTMI